MMKRATVLIAFGLACVALGCGLTTTGERNAFLTLVETFGIPGSSNTNNNGGGGGGGSATTGEFRRDMSVTLANNNTLAELNTTFAAWVSLNSIRSAEQQDALLNSGYVQLTREVRLGTVFTLPPGTFVYGGPGTAGGTPVRLGRAQSTGDANNPTVTPSTVTFNLITPDVILVYSQPPVSCESVAFFFTDDGDVLFSPNEPGGLGDIFGGSTGQGGLKTLAQVDAYQCEPLKPGLFLKLGGGALSPNEFFEGENVRFDFFLTPDGNDDAAFVTIE